MKASLPHIGPLPKRPFFMTEDFERICEDALARHELLPSEPNPIRIDRFVEKRFKVYPSYEDLPDGLLGFTHFGADGVEGIVVSKTLDEEGTQTAERRLRTTLAHECGHGLLHADLFALGARPQPLFEDVLDSCGPKILCRSGDVAGLEASHARKPQYRWWEYQANRAMAVLLLPRSLVRTALASVLVSRGVLGMPVLLASRRQEAIRLLADTFDVNPIVAKLRLEALFPATAQDQLTL